MSVIGRNIRRVGGYDPEKRRASMKAESTIRDTERWLRIAVHNPHLDERAQDMAYGAAEALRWVYGEGPNPQGLARTPVRRTPQ